MQMCDVSPSSPTISRPAVPPEHLTTATREQNYAGSSQGCQVKVTKMRMALTADSCHLTEASVVTSCASLAEAQELMGRTENGSIGEEQFEWILMFSFELFLSEGGIFPPRTQFLREDATQDILPTLLSTSINPLLHRIPSLAGYLGRVERVLQLRRHRLEAVLLRRRLLLALREGGVEDPPEIEESSDRNLQTKRKVADNIEQGDPKKRRKRSSKTSMQENVPLGESSRNEEQTLQNPQQIARELDSELGRLLNRHHSSCGWMGGGDVGEGEDCTGDSEDSLAHKKSGDGISATKSY